MTLLILAAGKGSRYGGLKQFDSIGPKDEFLFEYNMYDAIQAGFDRIVLITRPESVDMIQSCFNARLPSHVTLECVAQSVTDLPEGFDPDASRDKPWGTAHAVWCARNVIGEKFITVNADDLYGSSAFMEAARCIKDHRKSNQFGMVGYQLKSTLSRFGSVSRGICAHKNGVLDFVQEYTKIGCPKHQLVDEATETQFTGEELTSMNLWVLDPLFFGKVEEQFTTFLKDSVLRNNSELYLPGVIQQLIEQRQITVHLYESKDEWYGLTYQEDKEQLVEKLTKLTADRKYPSPVWS